MSGRLAVVDLETHRLLAIGLSPERAESVAAHLEPRYAILDESAWEVVRDQWDRQHAEAHSEPTEA